MALPRRRPLRRAILTAALCLVSAGVAAGVASAAMADGPEGGFRTYGDLGYVPGGNGQQVLDLYVPTPTGRPVPLIVYVHGGGWAAGDKGEITQLSAWPSFLSRGFAIASINYTLSGTATFPQQIYDLKAAIRYLRANAGRYHLNGKVGLWGGSAGGQLAALAGATCGVTPLEGKHGATRESSRVQAVADLSGPTDFLEMDTHLLNPDAQKHNPATSAESRYLGCAQGLLACPASTVERANPITYLTSSSDLPAYLIAHGDADRLVPHWESQILFDALTGVCADATFYTLHGEDHFFPFTGALNPPYPAQTIRSSRNCDPVTTTDGPPLSWDAIFAFFRAHLR